jgi:hypothetical protein
MVAMFVLLIGATGVMSLFTQGQRLHGDARYMTRATAIAEDLLANMEQWAYDNQANGTTGPLGNSQTGNDGNLGDTGYAFETSTDPLADGLADKGEADLPATFTGLPTAALGTDYQRFWNVAMPLNGTGGHDYMAIAVVVRWRYGPGGDRWHRIVLTSVKPNPATVH